MGEIIVEDYAKAGSCNAILLRYFNPVGAHPSTLIGELPIGQTSKSCACNNSMWQLVKSRK